MTTTEISVDQNTCKTCESPTGDGKHCKNCGQAIAVKRITLGTIAHEAFHFFTHLDKGFPFTVKTLLRHPGKMQTAYLEGFRSRHQKPF